VKRVLAVFIACAPLIALWAMEVHESGLAAATLTVLAGIAGAILTALCIVIAVMLFNQ